MKKFALITVLLLVACTSPQETLKNAYNNCPQIGIDVTHPDFYQKHHKDEVDEFYQCMEAQLQPGQSFVFGRPGSPGRTILSSMNQGYDTKVAIEPALEYQRNLWQEVFNKEKKPGAAYEAWVQWSQNERSIEATNNSGASIAHAVNNQTNAINNAAAQQNFQLQGIQQQQSMQSGR